MGTIFAQISITTETKSVEMHLETLSGALPGDNMSFGVKEMSMKDVGCDSLAGDSKNDLPMEAAGFTTQVIILNHPGIMSAGYGPELDCHTAHIACKFAKLNKVYCCSCMNLEDGSNSGNLVNAATIKTVPDKIVH